MSLERHEPYYPHQLTSFIDESVAAVFTSAVDNSIIFFAGYQGNENFQIYIIEAFNGWPQRITKSLSARHEWGEGCFSHDGQWITYNSNEQNPSDMHLYIKNIKLHTEPVCITDRHGWYVPGYWSPDNKKITCEQDITDIDSAIWLLDIENQDKNMKVISSEHDRSLNTPGAWSSDGRGFYFLTNLNDQYTYLAFYDVLNSKTERTVSLNWDMEDVQISRDGDTLFWIVNEDGYDHYDKKSLKTNETQEICLEKKVL